MFIDLDPLILWSLLIPTAFIVLDFLFGVIRAITDGTFDLDLLPEFLRKNIFPFIGGLMVTAIFAIILPEIKGILIAFSAAVVLKFLKRIEEKISDILNSNPD